MNSLFSKEVLNPIMSNILDKPDLRAFCISEVFYSYRQFGEQISKIRSAIQESDTNQLVIGLVTNDDLETYASVIALWLEGKSYVPLHPNQPIDRCIDILNQIGTFLILDSSGEPRYSKDLIIRTKGLSLKDDSLAYGENSSDEDLAYVLFTSGSTGKPKGVMITRGNIGAFMDAFWKTGIQLSEDDRCLQCFDLTFDVSVQSFLVALIRGACVYTVPGNQPKYLYVSRLINDYRLTFGAMAPSMLRYLQPYFAEIDAESMRSCILTAEACPLSLAQAWSNCATNATIYDFYGPTEVTVYCTYYELKKSGENKSLNGIISIGKPLANLTAIIINEENEIVPEGTKGELCIAGGQVSPGYWKDPSRNNKAFFELEINKEKLRFYRTGDLCFRESDGNIMYIGRLDLQVKIQGFRVELGEIEFHSRKFLDDRNAVALAFENENLLTEIALFIESPTFAPETLLTYLRSKLPVYMVPSRVFFLPEFPLSLNHKIDRLKLKELIKI
jgi:D-alanine--poly(phosphoribitol) ligase subunit 1